MTTPLPCHPLRLCSCNCHKADDGETCNCCFPARWPRGRDGFYVEKYGGGRFTSVAWFSNYDDAAKEQRRLLDAGAWSGRPPRIVNSRRRDGERSQ